MNPFMNPAKLLPFLKNFYLHPDRIKKWPHEKMKRYRDKSLQKIIKYANTVPAYKKKYEKNKIKPEEIKKIKDISKLPYISKNEIVNNYPDGLLPQNYNKKNVHEVSTGGSTGKPVTFFTDFSIVIGAVGATHRLVKNEGLHWRKTKVANIGNFNPGKADAVSRDQFYSKVQSLKLLKNYRNISIFRPMKDIIKELNEFQPDTIFTYPTILQNLAFLKNKGHGDNIKPKVMFVSATTLDDYTKNYIQDAFECRVLNYYTSTEACTEAPIAVECIEEGKWHINYDYFHLEAVDKNMNPVEEGKRGRIVITRLFGKATPFIRYTGMDDYIRLDNDYECSCGLRTPIIIGGVEGRVSTSIITPDGTIYPAASFSNIHSVLKKLNTKKIKQFQIVQKKIDEIDFDIIIDEELRDTDPSVKKILEEIKKTHQKKVGPNVKLNVKEVNKIKSPTKDKPAPLIISKLSKKERQKAIQE